MNRVAAHAVGTLAPIVAGIVAGVVMPRGPVTTANVLALIVGALVVGAATGYLLRSRWAMLLAPVAYAAAFELASWPAAGTTVDWPRLDTSWGFVALLLGRGVHALVVIPALMAAAALGAAAARRQGSDGELLPVSRRIRVMTRVRRAATVATLVGVGALAFWVAMPASTPPVRDGDGDRIRGSIAELREVELGDARQWITVRGHSRDLPVLLYLPGGPGQSDLAQARVLLHDLERDFLVVTWDGRGIGRSYASFDSDLSQRDVVDETIELADHLRERFDEERIYLFGESGGSITGVQAVDRAPDRFHAWIGSGQMVDPRETDRRIWADLRAWARKHDDDELLRRLDEVGRPPYDDPLTYAWVMGHYDKLEGNLDPPEYAAERLRRSGVGFLGLGGSEYAAIDKVNAMRGLIDVFTQLYPTWQEIDLRESAAELEVPVYVFSGEHELAGRRTLALEWFEQLQAPRKRLYEYPRGGHAAAFENYRDFHRTLVDEVLPATYR